MNACSPMNTPSPISNGSGWVAIPARHGFGNRKITRVIAEVRMGRLQVEGNGIVNPRLNALRGQDLAEAVAIVAPNREHMIYVPASRPRLRQPHAVGVEHVGVPPCDLPPLVGPSLEVAQLHAEDRALDAVHPVVEALEAVLVPLFLAPVA